jgi:hypothetical protein
MNVEQAPRHDEKKAEATDAQPLVAQPDEQKNTVVAADIPTNLSDPPKRSTLKRSREVFETIQSVKTPDYARLAAAIIHCLLGQALRRGEEYYSLSDAEIVRRMRGAVSIPMAVNQSFIEDCVLPIINAAEPAVRATRIRDGFKFTVNLEEL